MTRQENLAYAMTVARQFDLYPSLEALDTLSDVDLVRIRGMPFHEFSELIERLIEADKDSEHQTPKQRRVVQEPADEETPKRASPDTKGIGEGARRRGRWTQALTRWFRPPRRNKTRFPHPDKVERLRHRLAKQGIFLVEADLLANFDRLNPLREPGAVREAAEQIISPAYRL